MSNFNRNLKFLYTGAILGLPSGNVLAGWGKPKYSSFPQSNSLNFYLPDFFLQYKTPWMQYPYWKEYTVKELLTLLASSSLAMPTWHILHKDYFDQTFAQLQQNFKLGRLKKAVPYIFSTSDQQMTLDQLQNCLIQSLHGFSKNWGYLYGCWNENEGFLGISPEVLFIHQENENPLYLQTMALAGTCHSLTSPEIFQTNPKESQEHNIVVEGIKKALQSIGKIEIKKRTILKLPHLYHLLTPIEVYLNKTFQFESIVKKLHPTPALGAFPKKRGWKWLVNYNQKIERKTFGIPFGIYCPSSGLSFCVIGIRQVQWNAKGMQIGAGCGIVKESCLEEEWQEIQLKLKTIHHLLAF